MKKIKTKKESPFKPEHLRVKIIWVFAPIILAFTLLAIAYYIIVTSIFVFGNPLNLDQETYKYVIPLLIAFVGFLTVRKRLFIVTKNFDNDHLLHLVLYALYSAIAVSISFNINKKFTGQTVDVLEINEIENSSLEGYYKVKSLAFDNLITSFVNHNTKGRQNNSLEFNYYGLRKIKCDSCINEYWLTKKYYESISNRKSDTFKNQVYQRFQSESKEKFAGIKVQLPITLKRWAKSGLKSDLIGAIESGYDYKPKGKIIVLSADNEYEPGFAFISTLNITIISLLVFTIGFLLFPVSKPNLKLQINGKVKDDFFDMTLKFLRLRKDTYAAPLLVITIVIVHIYLYILGVNPIETSIKTLSKHWILDGKKVAENEYFRLFTSIFMHSGIMHISYNLVSLVLINMFLEKNIKPHFYLLFFIIVGVLCSIATLYINPNVYALGASGAIYGLYGLAFTWSLLKKIDPFATFFLGLLSGFGLLFGFLIPNTGNTAHITGFVLGVIAGLVFTPQKK